MEANRPSVEQLSAFYQQYKPYVDLIVENALENNPLMQEAKQMKEQLAFEQQMKEFAKEFPESGIQSAKDFMQQENAEQFLQYIKKGLSLSQAYKLCNYQALMERASMRGKKLGMERMQGKSHLKPTGANAAGESGAVPEDVRDFYHALLGDWSDSEISKHYHRK